MSFIFKKFLSSQSGNTWHVMMVDGTVHGPMRLPLLVTLAENGRILPGTEISRDGKSWIPAEELQELRLEWILDFGNGEVFGPFNLAAARSLFKDREIPEDARLTNKTSGKSLSAKDTIDEMIARAAPAGAVRHAAMLPTKQRATPAVRPVREEEAPPEASDTERLDEQQQHKSEMSAARAREQGLQAGIDDLREKTDAAKVETEQLRKALRTSQGERDADKRGRGPTELYQPPKGSDLASALAHEQLLREQTKREAESKIAELNIKIAALQDRLQLAEKNSARVVGRGPETAELAENVNKLAAELEDARARHETALQEAADREAKLTDRMRELDAERSREIEDLQSRLSEAQSRQAGDASAGAETAELAGRINELTAELENARARHDTALKDAADREAKLTDRMRELDAARAREIKDLQHRLREAQGRQVADTGVSAKAGELDERIRQLTAELEAERTRHENTRSRAADNESKLSDRGRELEAELARTSGELARVSSELAKKKLRHEALQQQSYRKEVDLTKRIEQLLDQAKRFEERIHSVTTESPARQTDQP